ncbi:MAG TPA: O-antigen ligase family protein [Roseiarcus sp.]
MTLAPTSALTHAPLASRAWLERGFLAAIVLTTFAYGSASSVQSSFAAIAFSGFAIVSALRPIGSAPIRVVRALAILLAAVLLGYAAFQTLPIPGAAVANGAWRSVTENIGTAQATISVAPGMTLDALPSLALPFLAFVGALVFFQGDHEALRLWRALAYFGAGYAVFGILQELFFPGQLLFETKRAYVGSLTATFVNRNTAGAFFGLAFLLNLGLGLRELRNVRLRSLVKKAAGLDIRWPGRHAQVLLHAFTALDCAVALFLTQSRGAVGATFVAAFVAVALIATRPMTRDQPVDGLDKWPRRAAAIGALLVVASLFALLAGRSAYRMQEGGVDDGRWCAFTSILQAIRDNWLWGAGFGAFQDVFPVYRDFACAGIFGVWERAHNLFLEGWLGLGVLFLAVLAVGYVTLAGVFVHGVRVRHKLRFAPIFGLAALVLATLHSIVDFSLQIPGFAVYFAAVMAAATTLSLGRARR